MIDQMLLKMSSHVIVDVQMVDVIPDVRIMMLVTCSFLVFQFWQYLALETFADSLSIFDLFFLSLNVAFCKFYCCLACCAIRVQSHREICLIAS